MPNDNSGLPTCPLLAPLPNPRAHLFVRLCRFGVADRRVLDSVLYSTPPQLIAAAMANSRVPLVRRGKNTTAAKLGVAVTQVLRQVFEVNLTKRADHDESDSGRQIMMKVRHNLKCGATVEVTLRAAEPLHNCTRYFLAVFWSLSSPLVLF